MLFFWMFFRKLSEWSSYHICNERQRFYQSPVRFWLIMITFRKTMASYSVHTQARQKSLVWGPYFVVCKRMKKDTTYCKLWVQIQYVSFNSTFSIPKNLKADDEVKFISLRLINSVIPVSISSVCVTYRRKSGGDAVFMWKFFQRTLLWQDLRCYTIKVLWGYSLWWVDDLHTRLLIPCKDITTDNLDIAMYWGRDNYIGECSVPLTELVFDEENENVLQVWVRCLGDA